MTDQPPPYDPENITVLIPAAGPVPEGVLALSNVGCPAMIPVAGRPLIYWTMSYLLSLGLRRFKVAVAERGRFVEDFVACVFDGRCEVEYLVPPPGGPADSLAALLARVETGAALVVLGDTHFTFADPAVLGSANPFVLTGSVEESDRWCVARLDDQGRVTGLLDKVPDLPLPLHALAGVYFFPDAAAAASAAKEALDLAALEGRRAELSQVLGRLPGGPLNAHPAGEWLDSGNPDRQAESHRVLLQKRAFNELAIDPLMGTIVKRSRNAEKFIDEINYLRLLPPDLAVLFPRLLGYSTAWDGPWVEMEYYGYPSLAEVFVFENVNPGIWGRIFTHLHAIVTRSFGRHRRPLPAGRLREMYVEKTRDRLLGVNGPSELLALIREPGPVTVNGRRLLNLNQLWPRIKADVDRMSEGAEATVIHGDFCLSNILYDLRSGICKLIDPRGSFGPAGITGDPRYDVAKLYHSVYGLYDLITNDLFSLQVDGTDVRLNLPALSRHTDILRQFERTFFSDFDRGEIQLLTGLLFASMPALHYDRPRRQLAMYARALEILADLYGGA